MCDAPVYDIEQTLTRERLKILSNHWKLKPSPLYNDFHRSFVDCRCTSANRTKYRIARENWLGANDLSIWHLMLILVLLVCQKLGLYAVKKNAQSAQPMSKAKQLQDRYDALGGL